MEIRIRAEEIKTYELNEEVSYEEFEGLGYFFIPTTGKIIVMNESSFCLWNIIKEYASSDKELSKNEIIKKMGEKFDLSNIPVNVLNEHIQRALFHFEQEEFMSMVK